jgi:hypothetical protein
MSRPKAARSPVLVSVFLLTGWGAVTAGCRSQQPPPATTANPASVSNQEANDAFVKQLSKQIEGREQEPASAVFKNIQLDNLKKTPASRFLAVMNFGYSRALGVKCTHCHMEADFSSDDKRPKKAAREMAVMHFGINQRLAKMENLETNPEGHFVICNTCHRGAVKPSARGLSTQEVNDAFVQRMSKLIEGHEQEPASEVFENIQLDILKNDPASQFLDIMNFGYSRALGVQCTHCHEEADFSSDAKRPKRAAREMALMHTSINQQLAKMENLEPNPKGHNINCAICHRGAVKPTEQ